MANQFRSEDEQLPGRPRTRLRQFEKAHAMAFELGREIVSSLPSSYLQTEAAGDDDLNQADAKFVPVHEAAIRLVQLLRDRVNDYRARLGEQAMPDQSLELYCGPVAPGLSWSPPIRTSGQPTSDEGYGFMPWPEFHNACEGLSEQDLEF